MSAGCSVDSSEDSRVGEPRTRDPCLGKVRVAICIREATKLGSKPLLSPISTGANADHTGIHADPTGVHAGHE
jgi:hypothetical protein